MISITKYWKWLASSLGIAFAMFSFFASNSPEEVKSRSDAWLSIPLIGQIPSKLAPIAASPWVLASSFFLLGGFAGWLLAKRRKAGKPNLWYSLGNEMVWMANRISEIDLNSNFERLNADLIVLAIKVDKQGLPFPTNENGFESFQSLLPYLNQVSALLKANEIDHARRAASRLSTPTS